MKDAVVFKGVRNGLELRIDGDQSFHDIEENLHQKLEASSSFFNAGLEVTIICEARPLSYIEVADFEEILNQYGLVLKEVLRETPQPPAYQSARKALEKEESQIKENANLAEWSDNPELSEEVEEVMEDSGAVAAEEMPYLFEPAPQEKEEISFREETKPEEGLDSKSKADLKENQEASNPADLFETDPSIVASGEIQGGALVFRRTLRNGQTISYPGVVVVIGDVNPGAEIISGEDVFIHGTCRGIVHAGIPNQRNATITANKLMATQIRIADVIARSPDKRDVPDYPERAVIKEGKILIEKM